MTLVSGAGGTKTSKNNFLAERNAGFSQMVTMTAAFVVRM